METFRNVLNDSFFSKMLCIWSFYLGSVGHSRAIPNRAERKSHWSLFDNGQTFWTLLPLHFISSQSMAANANVGSGNSSRNFGHSDIFPTSGLVRRFGTEHHELKITPQQFKDFIPEYISLMDEPVTEAAAISL